MIQAAEQYRSTVLTAFQNVADTLTALEQDAEGLKAAAAAADAAKVTLDLAQRQLQDGYAGYLALLSAEQAYQQAGSIWCRRRPVASPTPRRCFRRWAAAGGTAPILTEDRHDK